MKTKKQITNYILENCTDDRGNVLLNDLDFSNKRVFINKMAAKEIYQNSQRAEAIHQHSHEAKFIDNSEQKANYIKNNHQEAAEIDNRLQTILPKRKIVEFEINEEEQIKLNHFLKEMRK